MMSIYHQKDNKVLFLIVGFLIFCYFVSIKTFIDFLTEIILMIIKYNFLA